MIHSVTQKNGSTLQSEYQDQRKETPSTQHTVLPTIQDGMREGQRFCTVKNPLIRTKAREKVHVRDTNADVIAFTNATNAGNKHNFSEMKVDNISVIQKKAAGC
jgi:hypothetical protein